jgi:tetratricopeptide (TPR) repeat protein
MEEGPMVFTRRLIPLLALGCLAATAACAPVAEVLVQGNVTVKTETILAALRPVVRVGDELPDLERTRAAARAAALALGYFSEVQVTDAAVEGGLRLVVTVTERRRATRVSFEGVTLVPVEDLQKALSTRPGVFMDVDVAQRDAERIQQIYAARGYLAVVTEAGGNDRGEVVFRVLESRVGGVQIAGLHTVKLAEVADLVKLPPEMLYDAAQVTEAVKPLAATGYFSDMEITLVPAPGDASGHVIVRVLVAERPGIFPDRVGVPLPVLDPARLRSGISTMRLDIRYQAAVQVNEYLLELEGDLPQAVLRVGALARDVDPARATEPQADALLSYARALAASRQDAPALVQYGLAVAAFGRLSEAAPGSAGLAVKLARSLQGTGDSDRALEVLRGAVARCPESWEPRCLLAQLAARQVLAAAAKAVEAAGSAPGRPSELAAVAELIPWETSRAAALAALALDPAGQALTPLAREARQSLLEAMRLVPAEPRVFRVVAEITVQALARVLGPLRDAGEVWAAVAEDTEALMDRVYDMSRLDPGLALWSAFLQSPRAVLALVGEAAPPGAGGETAGEFRVLGERLTTIGRRWPHALRAAGGVVGMAHFLAGDDARAVAAFETLITENPRDPDAYNALIGLAYSAGDWAALDAAVRRKIAQVPALSDYLILGKSAERQGKAPEALEVYRQAMAACPDQAAGYLCAAAALLRSGTGDAEAAQLLEKAQTLSPGNGYGLALRTALDLLQGQADPAVADLRAALAASPTDDLANFLRGTYFAAP